MESTPDTTGNLFLDSLESELLASLFPQLERFDVTGGTVVARPRETIKRIIFPLTCAVSIVTRMKDGSDVEAMFVGREGFYGLHAILGNEVSGNEAVVQVPGSYLAIPAEDFVQWYRAQPAIGPRMLSYAHVMLETIAQFSACNRLHSINERGARWLLMAHDRAHGDTISITHEYLATMLGVRRPGVSLATAALDQAGFINANRGRIVIRDRVGLESAACECYAVVNATLERILGYSVRKHVARVPMHIA